MARQSSHRENGDARVAIIAGYGRLPVDVALAARQQGIDPVIFALSGEADHDWSDFDHLDLPIANFSKAVKMLRMHKVDRIILAGGVRKDRKSVV